MQMHVYGRFLTAVKTAVNQNLPIYGRFLEPKNIKKTEQDSAAPQLESSHK